MLHLQRIMRQLAMTAAVLTVLIGASLTLSISLSYLIDPDAYAEFFGSRDPDGVRRPILLLHVCGGTAALVLGALQLLLRRSGRPDRRHRIVGWLYATSVCAGASGALAIAPFSLGGATNAAGFGLLGLIWAGVTATGIVQGLFRDPAVHRRWMILSYALTCAAISLRLQLAIFQAALGLSYAASYTIVAWSCWVPNLAIAVWVQFCRKRAGP